MPPLPLSAPAASHAAMEEAADWFVRLRSSASVQESRAWQSWLDASADHRHAWSYVEAVSRRFLPIQTAAEAPPAAAALHTVRAGRERRASRRQVLSGVAAGVATLAGTGTLGWLAWRHTPLPGLALAWSAEHRTATGEVRQLALPDGSQLWLGSATALDTDYRPTLRRLRLHAGEALIQTAHDATRPFVLDTAQGRLRALGTRFSVRMDGDTTLAAVQQGAIEIRTARSGHTHVLQAGRQTRFSTEAIVPDAVADPARESWTRGVLLASDLPLGELVAELARYQRGHIGVSPEVAGLRVLGGYPLHDTGRALAMLEAVLPIRVSRPLPWWTRIEARSEARSPS